MSGRSQDELERRSPDELAGDADLGWARALSAAARLRPLDEAATAAALQAVRAERRARAASRRRGATATGLAAAATLALLAVLPPNQADPSPAYGAYLEAARAW